MLLLISTQRFGWPDDESTVKSSRTASVTRSHEPLERRRSRSPSKAAVRQPADLGKDAGSAARSRRCARALGERRSLESMVFVAKLPLWEGLGCAVMRCAGAVQGWVRGYGMVFGAIEWVLDLLMSTWRCFERERFSNSANGLAAFSTNSVSGWGFLLCHWTETVGVPEFRSDKASSAYVREQRTGKREQSSGRFDREDWVWTRICMCFSLGH